jgi:hypothetical protein
MPQFKRVNGDAPSIHDESAAHDVFALHAASS